MSTLLIYVADFVLGFFVGTLALASFGPAPNARWIYKNAWYIGLVFVGLSFFQKSIYTPTLNPPSSFVLGFIVIIGICTSLFGGLFALKTGRLTLPIDLGPDTHSNDSHLNN